MKAAERRLRALEAAEWDRLHALPPRLWFDHGYIRLDRLPEPERVELESCLSRLWDGDSNMVPERLTTDDRHRVLTIMEEMERLIPVHGGTR